MLCDNAVPVLVNGFSITVPEPEAYAIHKMIINHMRGKKAGKDRESVAGLLPYLNGERFSAILTSLGKKEKAFVDAYPAEER